MQDGTSAQATTGDGSKIAYRLHGGSGAGRVVLVHSLAMDGGFWDRVAALLLDAAQVLVYDCRGHGRSDKPQAGFSVERHADDLEDLLAVVGWQRAVVAGASMGGCIALAFAAAYPQRVAGLGLFDTTAWYGADAQQQWEERGQKALQGGMAALIAFQKSRWFSEAFLDANPALVDKAVQVFLDNDPATYLQTCRMLGAVDLRAALPNFSFPTRVLVGSEDYATPVAMADALQAAIPGATLRVVEAVRHFTPIECPAAVADELKALLETAS